MINQNMLAYLLKENIKFAKKNPWSLFEERFWMDYEEEDNEPKIIKRKSFELVPMDSDEAILQMEMLGHSFLVYLDAQSGNVCVVYKRKDGQYGLIDPTY